MPDVRLLIIETLAELRGRDPVELDAELRENGCDSVWLVKGGVKTARRLGFELTPATGDAKHFKTVEALAAYLEARHAEQGGER